MPTSSPKQKSSSTQTSTADPGTLELNRLSAEFQKFLDPYRRSAVQSLYNPNIPGALGLKYSTPEEAAAVGMFSDLSNIDKLMAATQAQFESTALPGILSKYTASGFGRSGAEMEAISRANMDAVLPVIQEGRAAQGALGNVLLGIGQNRIGSASNLISMPMPYQPQMTTTMNSKSSGGGAGTNPMDIISGGLKGAQVLFPKGLQG